MKDIINDHKYVETYHASDFLRNAQDIEAFPTGSDFEIDDKNIKKVKLDQFTVTRTTVPTATSPDTKYLGGGSPIQKYPFSLLGNMKENTKPVKNHDANIDKMLLIIQEKLNSFG